MRYIVPLVLAALALAGCAMSHAQRDAKDNERCASYGFRGSTEYARCRLALDQQRRAIVSY